MLTNRVLGSSALIIGTSIGGGILSLPLITAACGPVITILLLTLCWWAMYESAKNVLVLCHQQGSGVDFTSIISAKLTPLAHLIFLSFYFLLLYSLLSAYLVQGGELTRLMLNRTSSGNDLFFNKCVFIAVFGLLIFSISFTDKINKVFLGIKLLLFFSLCAFLAYSGEINKFFGLPLSLYALVYALPTLIISFGFHNIIPTLYEYQQGDFTKTKRAVFYGGLFVLLVYIVWVLVCFFAVSVADFHHIFLLGNRTEDFVKVLAGVVENERVKDGVFLFVNFSVVTSFLGVSLSLKHYIKDVCVRFKLNVNNVSVFLIVFLVPLIFNMLYPNGFIISLQYASIFAVVIFMWVPLYVKGLEKKLDYAILLFGGVVILFQLFNLFVNLDPFRAHL